TIIPGSLPTASSSLRKNSNPGSRSFARPLLTRGLPRKLYVDNGAAFRSRHLERICASLGIALIHSRPYTPQGRGKIERSFAPSDPGLSRASMTKPDTLAQLNERFQHWLETDYLHRVHSSPR
ncbi:MAG: transposase family protein, partial [Desulfofustis sp. PB-SRB1]|nr:transposase family protein [Desulfofustis sp. PB-SRB1]